MDYEMTIYFQQKWTDQRLAWGLLPRSNLVHPNPAPLERRRKRNMNQIHAQLVERLWRPGSNSESF